MFSYFHFSLHHNQCPQSVLEMMNTGYRATHTFALGTCWHSESILQVNTEITLLKKKTRQNLLLHLKKVWQDFICIVMYFLEILTGFLVQPKAFSRPNRSCCTEHTHMGGEWVFIYRCTRKQIYLASVCLHVNISYLLRFITRWSNCQTSTHQVARLCIPCKYFTFAGGVSGVGVGQKCNIFHRFYLFVFV